MANLINIPIPVIHKNFLLNYVECAKSSNIDQRIKDFITIDMDSDCYRDLTKRIVEFKSNEIKEIRSRGLGDTIYRFTSATKLDKLSDLKEKITGKPCNCHEKAEANGKSRQEKLNHLFPYRGTTDNKQTT